MALKSGVTAEDHRFALQADIASAGDLRARTGLFPNGANPANLVSVGALQAKVTPFQAFVAGTSATTQSGYRVTSDADVTLTFDAGAGTNPRIDLVVLRVRDDPYDATGFQAGTVEIIFGIPAISPTAPSIPPSCLPLWQVPIPANASSGNPIDFTGTRVDRRVYTAAAGGIIPVASAAERDGVVTPHVGMQVWRTDRKWVEAHDGIAWRVQGVATATNYADLAAITDPVPGQVAITSSDNIPWMWTTLLGPGLWISPLLGAFPVGFTAWAPWAPVLAQDSVVTATVTSAGYQMVGKAVFADCQLTVTGTGSATNYVAVSLPVPAAGTVNGSLVLFDTSAATYYTGVLTPESPSSVKAAQSAATGFLGATGSGFTAALAAGDTVTLTVVYEAA